jgi:hypothetical protein
MDYLHEFTNNIPYITSPTFIVSIEATNQEHQRIQPDSALSLLRDTIIRSG